MSARAARKTGTSTGGSIHFLICICLFQFVIGAAFPSARQQVALDRLGRKSLPPPSSQAAAGRVIASRSRDTRLLAHLGSTDGQRQNQTDTAMFSARAWPVPPTWMRLYASRAALSASL
jgi:hypothetical protein